MKLRPYQQDAVDALLRDAKKYPTQNLLAALPTGCGKSVIIASLCKTVADKGGRVLVLARSKELLSQNSERFCQVDPKGLERVGIYSAGLGMRQLDQQVTFAGVQSIVNCIRDLGKVHAIIVDEAHNVSSDENSQYQTVIQCVRELNPRARFIGLTATPYRLDRGVLFGGSDTLFDRLSYNCRLADMFDEGYLTAPETLPTTQVDLTNVKKTAGDYNKSEMQSAFLKYWTEGNKTAEIKQAADDKGCKSVIVYASGVAHAELILHELTGLGERAAVVTGETLPLIRATQLDRFDSGNLRWLVNVDCLTTGYDCPRIDCVVMARSTMSCGLFMQICGRGMRLFEGKDKFYVLDMGNNIETHGPIDSDTYGINTIKDPSTKAGEAPKKVCSKCFEIVHASAKVCPKCLLEFPERPKDMISTTKEIRVKTTVHTVLGCDYKLWKGKELEDGTKKPDTMLAQYRLQVDEDADLGNRKRWAREWICLGHPMGSYARGKAEQWWSQRSHTSCPETIEEALMLIDAGALAKTVTIHVRPDGKFDKIVKTFVADRPAESEYDMSDVPF